MVIVEEEGRELLKSPAAGIQTDSDYEDIDEEYEDDGEGVALATASSSSSSRWSLSSIQSRIQTMFTQSSLSGSFSRMYSFISSAIWILTTSLILVGLPVLYAYDREQNAISMEREQQRFEAK